MHPSSPRDNQEQRQVQETTRKSGHFLYLCQAGRCGHRPLHLVPLQGRIPSARQIQSWRSHTTIRQRRISSAKQISSRRDIIRAMCGYHCDRFAVTRYVASRRAGGDPPPVALIILRQGAASDTGPCSCRGRLPLPPGCPGPRSDRRRCRPRDPDRSGGPPP